MNLPGFLKGLFPSKKPDELRTAQAPQLGPGPQTSQSAIEIAAEPRPDKAALAPYPAIDRYPAILGSNVSLAYISSVFRLCLTGYRREFVDLLDELLERDPHTYAVVAQRVHAVAGGRIQVIPAETKPGSADEKKAADIAEMVDKCIRRIPDLQQSIAKLQWGGVFYGVGCAEISWGKDELGWRPTMLHWVHSRRLAYPDAGSWSVRIWDQGMVSSFDVQDDPTSQLFGVKCDDFPGKFIVHTPSVRGNYPTRDGLGREVAYWSALKLMGARGAAQYIERFGKPWTVAYYSTQADGHPREADEEDIKAVDAAGRALGIGSLANATLPDSTKLDIFGPAKTAPSRQLLHVMFINACNGEISKAVLGQTDTTEAGPNGSRAATETRKEGTKELYRYDAACLADALERSMVRWIVRLNFPADEHLCPSVLIHAEKPDLDALLDRAIKASAAGAVVDGDRVCEEVGVPTLAKPTPGEKFEGRRMFPMAALKPYEIQSLRKLDAGEELEPPPKLTDPSAEGEGGAPAASGGAEGVDSKAPPKGKPTTPAKKSQDQED
jgi:phage gp29-like protein